MMDDIYSISFPMPSSKLTAHAGFKGGFAKASLTKKYRKQAKEMSSDCPKWDAAILSIHITFQDLRHTDVLNKVGLTKPLIDGIVDSGLIPDDSHCFLHIDKITHSINRGKGNARIDLNFKRSSIDYEVWGESLKRKAIRDAKKNKSR